MLTLEEEERAQELRRELVVLLHVSQKQMTILRQVTEWRAAFAPLEEVRSIPISLSRGHAAVRIAAPLFLGPDRLRPILARCSERLLGTPTLFSLRVLTELGDTIQAAFDLEEVWLETGATAGQAVLSFTDEHATGEVDLLLSDLKSELAEGLDASIPKAFPLNHYDILSLWAGPEVERLSSTEEFISRFYGKLKGAPVGATSRSLDRAPDLLRFLGSGPRS